MKASYWLALACAVSVAACSTIAGKSPDEMARYATQRAFTTDNQFNFAGTVTVSQASPEMAATSGGMDEWMKFWLEHTSIPFTGAVDAPRKVFEITPELRYEAPNALLSVKVPMYGDLNEVSLWVDPAAVTPFIKIASPEIGHRIEGKSVLFKLPESMRQSLALDAILTAWPKATDRAEAGLDRNAFALLPMDQDGQKVGATYRVALSLEGEALKKYSNDFYTYLAEEVEAIGEKQPEAGVSAEQYQTTASFIREWGNLQGTVDDDEVGDALGTAADQMKMRSEMYLGGNGRILAWRQAVEMPMPDESGGNISATMWVTTSNFGKPVFHVKPEASRTVEVTDLLGSGYGGNTEGADHASLPEGWQKLVEENPNIMVDVTTPYSE
ncbi:MAG: hypothetical protein Q4G42_09165 [Neisseria sp.]|nr:hypothetical protein [Neisseria sp.]